MSNISTGRRTLLGAIGLAVGGMLAPVANAQGTKYPERPIRVIVPFAPGGTSDVVGRRFGQRISEVLGVPVVIENRAGANSAIGAEAVAKAPADGYTLLLGNDSTLVASPVLYPNLPYDVQRDFTPVALVAYLPVALVVNAATPVSDMKQLAAYVKGRKDLSYGSFGAGSQPHLMGEMFKKVTQADLVHVAYKGAGPAVMDVLADRILFTFAAFPSIKAHVDAGKLKVLAVSGDKRVSLAPQVETFTEAGFAEVDMGVWYGFVAPAGTPREIVDKLNATITAIASDEGFIRKNMTSEGMAPMAASPQQMGARIRSDRQRFVDYVKKSGARID